MPSTGCTAVVVGDEPRQVRVARRPPFTRSIHPTATAADSGRCGCSRVRLGGGHNDRFRHCWPPADRPVIATTCRRCKATTRRPGGRGEFGHAASASAPGTTGGAARGLPPKVSTSMTINSPAARSGRCTSCGRKGGGAARPARGHAPERHPQGVHPRRNSVSPSRDALVTDHRVRARAMPRGTRSRSADNIREAGRRRPGAAFTIADGMAYVEHATRARLRVDDFAPRCRSSAIPLGLLRGDRQVPGESPHLARPDDQALRRRERRSPDALPHQTAGVSLTSQQRSTTSRESRFRPAGVLGGRSRCTPIVRRGPRRTHAEAALLALRQQQVIAEETASTPRSDPSAAPVRGGADRRDRRQVWRYLDEIDERGGMVAAISGATRSERSPTLLPYQREFDAGGGSSASTHTSMSRRRRPCRAGRPAGFARTAAGPSRPDAGAGRVAVDAALRGCATQRHDRVDGVELDAAFHPERRGVAPSVRCGVLRGVFGEYREPVAV